MGLIYHRPVGENSSFQFTPLVCQVTGIVYEVQEFRSSVSVTCLKIVGQNKNVSSAVRTIHIKDARTEKIPAFSSVHLLYLILGQASTGVRPDREVG